MSLESPTSITDWILAEAPALIAAGDIRDLRGGFALADQQDLAGLDYAISLAFPLPPECLAGVKTGPTFLYKHAYTQVNFLMDRVALMVALRLHQAGRRALAVPASQFIDWEGLRAHVDHRQVAVRLGQGWYGRNNLLVTPSHGAQVRLVTILTDADCDWPGPAQGRDDCGSCRRCADVCPAGAIHDGPRDFDRPACAQKTREFEKIRGIGQRICGVCVRACPRPEAP